MPLSAEEIAEFRKRADPEQRQPCRSYREDVPRLNATIDELKARILTLMGGTPWDDATLADLIEGREAAIRQLAAVCARIAELEGAATRFRRAATVTERTNEVTHFCWPNDEVAEFIAAFPIQEDAAALNPPKDPT